MADLLLIENDERIVELLAWFLAKRGHTVRVARSFREARVALAAQQRDLLLSDLDLGSESGRDELPRLARDGLLPQTLVVSGFIDGELERELTELSAIVGSLRKPFDSTTLEVRIAAALARAPELEQAVALNEGGGIGVGWTEVGRVGSKRGGERP